MSVWTHVVGTIRIDSIVELDIESKMGKILLWESPSWNWDEQEEHPELYTPTGSEGGIQYQIIKNPEECSLAKYTICIWGDLRDVDDFVEIKDWFDRIIYHSNFIIRDAVLSITGGLFGQKILSYDKVKKEGYDK